MHTEHGRQRWDLILKGFRRRYELCLEEPKIVYEAKGKKIFHRRIAYGMATVAEEV